MERGLIQDSETYSIIGAAMEVHRQLGPGFLEAVYEEALEFELAERGIPFESQVPILVKYKKQILTHRYRADLIVRSSIIVELKAQARTTNVETAQMLNYLKATDFKKGLVINFGGNSLEYRRFVL